MRKLAATPNGRGSTSTRLASVHVAVIAVLGVLALTSGSALSNTGDRLIDGPDAVLLAPALLAEAGSVDRQEAAVVCPYDVVAADVPDDGGGALLVIWELGDAATTTDGSGEDTAGSTAISSFEILRFAPGEEPVVVGEAPVTDRRYVDDTAEAGVSYQYIVRALSSPNPGGGFTDSIASNSATATAQWFATSRLNSLLVMLFVCGAVMYYIARARTGSELYIRRIPGLEAVDDAVGRATEMGRPVLYVPGIETVSEISTLAALTILGHVAKKVAQHGTPLIVPTADPIVMTTAQEIVKQAYAETGQSDRYDPTSVSYLTYDQFGYTAGVDGIMVRERPEAVFLLGYFAAESLILAETGHEIGAIQISGTKETSQLPFFVAACDYTLIGEELFAASSYLSHEPVMLGSLKGQDFAKFWIVVLIVTAVVVGTVGYVITPDGSSAPARIFDAVKTWFAGG